MNNAKPVVNDRNSDLARMKPSRSSLVGRGAADKPNGVDITDAGKS